MAEYQVEGWEITGRRPGAFDDQGRAVGEVDVEGEGYKAVIRYVLDGSELTFRSVTIESDDHVSSTLMRKPPLGDVRDYLRQTAIERPEFFSMPALLAELGATGTSEKERRLLEEQVKRAATAAELLAQSRVQRGRGATNDETWAAVAELYLYSLRVYGQKAVKGLVIELERRENIFWARSTVKTYVRRARELGWLTKGSQGKAGADPGPRLLQWRKEKEA